MAKLTFRYKVKDEKGKIRTGRAIATDAGQVRKLLIAKSYTIISVIEERGFFKSLSIQKVSARDRSIMYREMATMLRAGVSITQAIDIAAETPNRKLHRVLLEIAQSLQNGFPLSVAMAGHPKTFPVVETGVIRSGEATGNLAKVLDELATTSARSAEFVGKVRGAMIYPAFIVVVMLIIGLVIMTKVIPPIKDIFASTNTELPFSTKFLISFTDFLIHGYIYLVGVVVALLVIIRVFLMTKPGKYFAAWFALHFPVFGKLAQQFYLARFNRTLSLLVGAGVPIIEAVEIITESTGNIIFRDALRGLMRSLEQGSAISVSLGHNKYFPKLMTQLLYVGQQSGDLGGTASTLADYFETEVDNKLRTFSALLEPFIIVMLGLVVGFIVVSVLQPIYNLTGSF